MGMSDNMSSGNPMLGLVLSIFNRYGGVRGLGNHFKSRGLGNVFESWTSNSSNFPVDPGQMHSLFGDETMNEATQITGLPSSEVSQKLANFLPDIVDRLTPDGKVPEGPVDEKMLMSAGIGDLFGSYAGRRSA